MASTRYFWDFKQLEYIAYPRSRETTGCWMIELGISWIAYMLVLNPSPVSVCRQHKIYWELSIYVEGSSCCIKIL